MPADRSPRRIQRKRTKGWRLPEGTVIVSRPTTWGNPFSIAAAAAYCRDFGQPDNGDTPRKIALRWFREWLEGAHTDPEIEHRRLYILNKVHRLRGKDLACYCAEGEACHGDILLALANAEPGHEG